MAFGIILFVKYCHGTGDIKFPGEEDMLDLQVNSIIASEIPRGTPAIVQPTFAQSAIAQPTIAQSPMAQQTIAQSPITHPTIVQMPIAQSPIAQSPNAQPTIGQAPIAQPTIAQSPIFQPTFTQSTQPIVRPIVSVDIQRFGYAAPNYNFITEFAWNLFKV